MFDAKRLIGREWKDKAVQKFYHFKVIEKQSKPQIKVDIGSGKKQELHPRGDLCHGPRQDEGDR